MSAACSASTRAPRPSRRSSSTTTCAGRRGAAREAAPPPPPGWVEQDPEEVLDAVVEAVARGAPRGAEGEVVACGLDHQGESVLAWDAESGEPLTPIVTWQDKRSQEVLDRLEADGQGGRGHRAQRHAARPLLLGRQAHLAARARRRGRAARATPGRCGSARSTPSSATGSAPASPPTRRPPRAPSSARPSGTRALLEIFGVPARGAAGDRRHRRRPRRPAPRVAGRSSCRCARAASTSRRRSPAPAASSPASPRRPTAPASSSSPTPATSGPSPSGGLLPTVAWRVDGAVEWALDGGVFTAGALLEWLSRDLGLAADPPALAAAAGGGRGRRRGAGAARARRRRRAVVAARTPAR